MAPKSPDSVEGLRAAGNQSFRNGQYAEASALYDRALRLLQARVSTRAGSSDPEEESVLYSNRAACHLKNGNCSDCIKDCTLMTRALMDSLGPDWRQKLPPTPVVPVSAQKRWDSRPSENHKDSAKSKPKEPTTAKNKVPSAGDVERARVLKEEGNEFVKKGNHKKAIEKYSESLSFSHLESATYTNRALCYLALKQYKEAVKDCTDALKLDGKNVKAFYRRAQAYKALKLTALTRQALVCQWLWPRKARILCKICHLPLPSIFLN